MRSRLLLGGRVVAALLLLTSGILHLRLYFDSYRHTDVGGPFLLQAGAAFVVAVALVAWRSPITLFAGLALIDATLIGFGLSRTSRGVFGFTESGFGPSPDVAINLAIEIVAAVVLLVLIFLELRREPARRPALG
jgi:hypothetical protein